MAFYIIAPFILFVVILIPIIISSKAEKEKKIKLNEIRNKWKEEPDKWLIKAATEDLNEYSPEIQEVIKSEVKRRELKDVESRIFSISQKTENKEWDFFGPEKSGIQKGVVGGFIMIFIAVIWFFGGLACGYIFYYPPILFLIGIYALLKGIFTRNITGKKLKEVNSNKNNIKDIIYSRSKKPN